MGSDEKEQPSLPAGRIIGGCRIERLMGRGGMGEVYLAHHLKLRQPRAIKILRPDREGSTRVQRFMQEAIMAASVTHPNVVTIHNVDQQGDLYYIEMQFVDGQDLAELVKQQGGSLPWQAAVRIVGLAARGLAAVHNQGMIHRDIKPHNIMLSADSKVLLMDFGLVREETHAGAGKLDESAMVAADVDEDASMHLTGTGELIGTPAFMSPEQCRGEQLDRRSDIYSLGATLYYVLTGKRPFGGKLRELIEQVANGAIAKSVDSIDPRIPTEVARLVDKAMSPDLAQRFVDGETMARELENVISPRPTPPPPPAELAPDPDTNGNAPVVSREILGGDPEPEAESIWQMLRPKLPWVLVCAALLGIVIALLLLQKSKPEPTPGMIRIHAGNVQLGTDVEKVRLFLQQFDLDSAYVQEIIEIVKEQPLEQQVVPEFQMDPYEVTNSQYAKFLEQTGHPPPADWDGSSPPLGKEDHPVVNVSYTDADAYATWAQKKLPTREQWLRAFRSHEEWLFPWGDTSYDPARSNVRDNPDAQSSTTAVQSTPDDVSPFGVFNLVGNVAEFVREDESFVYEQALYRMVRGGQFNENGFTLGLAPVHRKFGPNHSDPHVGFRCVVEVEPPP